MSEKYLHITATEKDYSFLAQEMGCQVQIEEKTEKLDRAWIGTKDEALAPASENGEAYALKAEKNSLNIAANGAEGLSLGLRKYLSLLRDGRMEQGKTYQEKPVMRFRGLHLCIFPENDGTEKEDTSPEALRAMIREAALNGYNHVFLEFWGQFPYQRRPYACWPDSPYTPQVVKDLLKECQEGWHMQPIPVQNLTSHAGWSRIGSRKHVVLDQRKDLSPMWIPGGWCFATENPDTKAYLKDIMDELIDAYGKPPMLHVSTDKCFGFGSTEADRTVDADVLFVRHLNFLHDALADRGARMVMWADMLYGALDSKFWKASPAIVDQLPRDILMNVWTHNDPGACWPDVDFFQGKGFETIYSPFLNESSIRNMTDMCVRKKSLGILQTTWYCPQSAIPSVQLSGQVQWAEKIEG